MGEDHDFAFQVLDDGWCTVAMACYVFATNPQGENNVGGNAELYQQNGRRERVKALQFHHPEKPIYLRERKGKVFCDANQVYKGYRQRLVRK